MNALDRWFSNGKSLQEFFEDEEAITQFLSKITTRRMLDAIDDTPLIDEAIERNLIALDEVTVSYDDWRRLSDCIADGEIEDAFHLMDRIAPVYSGVNNLIRRYREAIS